MALVTSVAFVLLRFGLSRLVAISFDTMCHLASEYHCFLQLAAWTTWLGVTVVGALCTWQCKILFSYTMKWDRIIQWILSYIFIECCCYYSQQLTTLQSFWWRCSMQSTERIDGHLIQRHCCLCSWQLTIGLNGLLLWLGTVEVILHQGWKNHWMILSLRWPAAAWRAVVFTQNK